MKTLNKNLFIYLLFCFAFNTINAKEYVINVPKAGKLSSQIPKKERGLITSLKLIGEINTSDIGLIRELKNLIDLDLEDVNVVRGGKAIKLMDYKEFSIKKDHSLGTYLFSNLENIEAISLPKTLIEVEEFCFSECAQLKKLTVNSDIFIWPSSFNKCASLEIVVYKGKVTPQKKQYNSQIYVKEIISYVQSVNTEIFEPYIITWPESNGRLLCNAKKDDYTIPDGVTAIGVGVFKNNKDLEEVHFPSSVSIINEDAYRDCYNLKKITFSENIKRIGKNAFWNCKISSLTLPEKLERIQQGAFAGCPIENLILPSGIIEIEAGAFNNDKLKFIELKSSEPPVIAKNTFNSKNIKVMKIPKGSYDKYISTEIWRNYPLVEVGGKTTYELILSEPGNLLREIGPRNLLSVEELTIKGIIDTEDIKTIKEMVCLRSLDLSHCHLVASQKSVKQKKEETELLNLVVELTSANLEDKYKRGEISNEKHFHGVMATELMRLNLLENKGETEQSACYIFDKSFQGFDLLEKVILPIHTGTIGRECFADCPKLTYIEFPNVLRVIGFRAFSNCISLEKVDIPSLTGLGNEVFMNCISLKEIVLPEGLISIGARSFRGCDNLKEINIPSTVIEMESLFNEKVEIHSACKIPPKLKDKPDPKFYMNKIIVPQNTSAAYDIEWGKLYIVEKN